MKDKSLIMNLYWHATNLLACDAFETKRDVMRLSITTHTQLSSMVHTLELLAADQGKKCGILMSFPLHFSVTGRKGSQFY